MPAPEAARIVFAASLILLFYKLKFVKLSRPMLIQLICLNSTLKSTEDIAEFL
jgi:hypothetical protein